MSGGKLTPVSEQELVSCDGPAEPSDDDDPATCRHLPTPAPTATVTLSGECPKMFSPSVACAPSHAGSAEECCDRTEPIACAGGGCPTSGWMYVPHPPGAQHGGGNCTSIAIVTKQSAGGGGVPGTVSGLVPASDPGGNGCGGGQMDQAFGYLLKSKRGLILTEDSYPYTSGATRATGCCLAPFASKLRGGVSYGARIVNFTDVAHSEDEMAATLAAVGPISIAVDASQNWQAYKGGVLTNCTNGEKPRLDHGVLLVGYTAECECSVRPLPRTLVPRVDRTAACCWHRCVLLTLHWRLLGLGLHPFFRSKIGLSRTLGAPTGAKPGTSGWREARTSAG